MRDQTYEKDSFVLRQGDTTDRIHILWRGEVALEVERHNFGSLNQGSCFTIYSAFSDDKS